MADKESDSGVTAGHSTDVLRDLSTSPDIYLATGRDVEEGIVTESQQDRATMILLESRDDVKEQLRIKHKKTVHDSSSSSSYSDPSSSPQSMLSVLFYFFS